MYAILTLMTKEQPVSRIDLKAMPLKELDEYISGKFFSEEELRDFYGDKIGTFLYENEKILDENERGEIKIEVIPDYSEKYLSKKERYFIDPIYGVDKVNSSEKRFDEELSMRFKKAENVKTIYEQFTYAFSLKELRDASIGLRIGYRSLYMKHFNNFMKKLDTEEDKYSYARIIEGITEPLDDNLPTEDLTTMKLMKIAKLNMKNS